MSLLFAQSYVADMCESIEYMKITKTQKAFAQAVMRSAIDYANAKNGMHASKSAKAATQPKSETDTQ